MSALWCSLVALLLAGTGGQGRGMETVVQDDALLLHRTPAQVRGSARRLAALGADRVRLTAGWSALAPAARSRSRPRAPFDPRDSATYPSESFARLDTAIRAVRQEGLEVMVDVAFWAPRWAVGRGATNHRERFFPDPEAYGAFVHAVAERYSGRFPDPTDPRRPLPAVRLWTTWNEPNHPSFLGPQWIRTTDGGARPMSPHVYRRLHVAGYDALKAVSRDNRVLLGGTAASGGDRPGEGGVRPGLFARTLVCVDERLRPLRVPECRGFRPVRADGWAHHPYARLTTPATRSGAPDDAPLADLDRFGALLQRLGATGRLSHDLPLYLTEFGYESSQDDPFQPFDRDQQARFHAWSTFLAFREPRVRMFAQFLLRDIDPAESGRRRGTRGYYRDWQTGLYDKDDRPKPAVQAFKLPLWAEAVGEGAGRAVLLVGGVRPGRGAQTVRVERRQSDGSWVPAPTAGLSCGTDGVFRTGPDGFFQRATPWVAGAAYRLRWQRPDGVWETGVAVAVAPGGA